MSNGLAYSVAAASKNDAAAKAFVAYMGSKEAQIIGATGPTVPVFKGVEEVWAEAHKTDYDTSVIVEALKDGVPYYATLKRTVWEEKVKENISKIFLQEVSVEEGLKKAAEEMNAVLETE